MHQYFVKIVPTVYKKLSGEVNTNSFKRRYGGVHVDFIALHFECQFNKKNSHLQSYICSNFVSWKKSYSAKREEELKYTFDWSDVAEKLFPPFSFNIFSFKI